jgi:type I restriction enzyme S subunit
MTCLRHENELKPSDWPWLGSVPKYWEVKPLWSMYRPKKETGYPSETLLSVYRDYGVIEKSSRDDNKNQASEDLSGYQLIVPGDLVTNKMKTWQGSIAVSNIRGIVSPAYYVYRKHHLGNDAYFHYLFRSLPYITGYNSISKGIRVGQWDLEAEEFRLFPVLIPPRIEQDAIVSYLEQTTLRIDGLIAKKTHFIELLSEKREALITHTVTKGLNASVPMKDSGVEWLGTVPAHWDVVPPVALFTESKERAQHGDQMLSATQKYGVIPLADFEALEQRQVTKASANLEMWKHVEIGDFVISMRSMDGGLERSRAVGSVRSSYSVLKAGPCVEGRYFGSLLKCSLYIQALRLTSNFIRDGQDLSFTHVKKVKLPKPGLQEQAAIADYLESATARIDALITKTERSIELLREHRTALITAAVTGKIDLRNNVALRNAA